MTFPAWDAFDADARVKQRHLRVYRACRQLLDFREIRGPKLERLTSLSGVDKTLVSRVLDSLVDWGYLAEHERDRYNTRQFTLTWSVDGRRVSRVSVAPFATSGPTSDGDGVA